MNTTTTPDPERSRRQAQGARERWSRATADERKAATQRATAARKAGAKRSRAARELLASVEATLVAAGAEVRWPGSAR
jgi:hypothetical protein